MRNLVLLSLLVALPGCVDVSVDLVGSPRRSEGGEYGFVRTDADSYEAAVHYWDYRGDTIWVVD